jgi:hypothetical protein
METNKSKFKTVPLCLISEKMTILTSAAVISKSNLAGRLHLKSKPS